MLHRSQLHVRVVSLRLGAAVSLFIVAVSLPGAQQGGPPAQRPLQATSELVKLDVRVADRHGDFVVGLEEKDFRILDNGTERPAVFFAPVDAPAEVLVMVETSPAVYLIEREHLLAAYALLDALAPDDRVALIRYDQSPHAILSFTADKSALLGALGSIHYELGAGELNFYDAVSAVLDWLVPGRDKNALVLLTTGLDSSPPARWDALVEKVRGRDIVIFPVALGGSLRTYTGKKSYATNSAPGRSGSRGNERLPQPEGSLSFAKADQALRTLATTTGGRAYFPASAKDFVPIYREIASTLRHEYVLGIAPAHDGQFHSLRVQVARSNGASAKPPASQLAFRVSAREGYLAPGP